VDFIFNAFSEEVENQPRNTSGLRLLYLPLGDYEPTSLGFTTAVCPDFMASFWYFWWTVLSAEICDFLPSIYEEMLKSFAHILFRLRHQAGCKL
jgi:hypothetical protein